MSVPPYRWEFLQHGVEKIMRDLKEGIDMATVCPFGAPLRGMR